MTDINTMAITLAEKIINGYIPGLHEYEAIISVPEEKVMDLLPGAEKIRKIFMDDTVGLCTICNGKSGYCSEDCSFCSQSKQSKAAIKTYPILPKEELQAGALKVMDTPINRYSVVTSGKRLPKKEVMKIATAIRELDQKKLSYCASLGILDADDFKLLKQAGITRYHHNLETAKSHFDTVCTTHTYEDRVRTIQLAKEAGLSVCAGGLFGIGETDKQVLELALDLKALDVDAVPLNFLSAIKGTPMEKVKTLTPFRCLKIIALFRYVLPDKDIIVCGGRSENLKENVPLIFDAGANAMMTGDYLTTQGENLTRDLEMMKAKQLKPREK